MSTTLNPAVSTTRACWASESDSSPIRCSLGSWAGGAWSARSVPSFVYNTVDHPIFPNTGKRYTPSIDFAGLGGNTNYVNPRVEGICISSTSAADVFWFPRPGGIRRKFVNDVALPIFERLFLGGEYSIRGFDLRSVGPRDPSPGLCSAATRACCLTRSI